MAIKIEHIKHFSSEMAKIAREEMDPQEYAPEEGRAYPANKFQYKYQPWHTIPGGLAVGLGARGYGGIRAAIMKGDIKDVRKAQHATLAKHRSLAKLDPSAFLEQQEKMFPTIFAKSRSGKVIRKLKRQGSSAVRSSMGEIRNMAKSNKRLAIGLGLATAAAGPGVALTKKLIERKRQSMPQYQ